ncbi:TetR/AcrR family transcriptional regulator [Sphingomonas sp.]|uniref:TetR/AcrR family transcriptional regulator n=1 Tax=Sphingomonas sp. TaxID=28214 RepID=UPI003D6CAC99
MTSQQPPASPRTKPADVRRDELMDAAQALFLEKGIAGTIVDDIVGRAGASKGTFYHYFKAKPDIVVAIRERFSRDFRERAQAAVDAVDQDDWSGKIAAWTRSTVNGYLSEYQLHDILYHGDAGHGRGNAELNAVFDQIETVISAGRAANAWSVDNPRLTAVILFYAMHGVVDDVIASGLHDAATATDQLVAIFNRMLALPR